MEILYKQCQWLGNYLLYVRFISATDVVSRCVQGFKDIAEDK